MNKITKRAIIAGGLIAGLSAGFLVLAGHYYVNVAIRRGKKKYSNEKRRHESMEHKSKQMIRSMFATHKEMLEESKALMDDIKKEEKYITASDGIRLYGELFKQENSHRYVIIVHGYNCHLEDMYC